MPRTKDEILADLDPTRPETIQSLIDFHRQALGGFVMEDDGKDDQGQADDKGKEGGDADKGKGDTDDGGDQAKNKGGGSDDPDDEKNLGEAGKRAIRAERDARKALEKKLSDFEAAQADQAKKLAAALGIETKDAKSSDDVLESLKTEVNDLRTSLLVDKIARDTKITDESDIALIRGAGSEDAMRRLAARLAPKDGDSKKSDDPDDGVDEANGRKRRRLPRQDPSQGQGGGGQEKSGLDAGKAEALRRFPSKR